MASSIQDSYSFADFYTDKSIVGHVFLKPSLYICNTVDWIFSPIEGNACHAVADVLNRLFHSCICIIIAAPSALLIVIGVPFKGFCLGITLLYHKVDAPIQRPRGYSDSKISNKNYSVYSHVKPSSAPSLPNVLSMTKHLELESSLKNAEELLSSLIPGEQAVDTLITVKGLLADNDLNLLTPTAYGALKGRNPQAIFNEIQRKIEANVTSRISILLNEYQRASSWLQRGHSAKNIMIVRKILVPIVEEMSRINSHFTITPATLYEEIMTFLNQINDLFHQKHLPNDKGIIEVNSDGNCLYHSFIEGLRWIEEYEKEEFDHHLLRMKTIGFEKQLFEGKDETFLRILKDSLEEFIIKRLERLLNNDTLKLATGEAVNGVEFLTTCKALLGELQEEDFALLDLKSTDPLVQVLHLYWLYQSTPGEHGTTAEIYALAKMKNVNAIIKAEYEMPIYDNEETQGKGVYLAYIVGKRSAGNENPANHYDAYIPPYLQSIQSTANSC